MSFIDNLSGVTLPVPTSVPSNVQGLGTILTVSGILALLFPFIGGAIGGAWGTDTRRRRPYHSLSRVGKRNERKEK